MAVRLHCADGESAAGAERRGVTSEAQQRLRESGACAEDAARGTLREKILAAYGAVDFSLIAEEDPMWGDGSTRESLEACAARGAEFVRWLMARPEAEIAVACHSTFLLALFNGALAADGDVEALCAHFGTGEMRTVVLAPSAS